MLDEHGHVVNIPGVLFNSFVRRNVPNSEKFYSVFLGTLATGKTSCHSGPVTVAPSCGSYL